MTRIYLSPPEVGDEERSMLLDAFDSNWIAPLGPHVDAFERELAERVGIGQAVALSSGTAALHLALLLLGVGPGDEVLIPSFTFVATAGPVCQLGARPVFVDCSPGTWNIDPDLVTEELASRARQGRLPRALVTVDLYGQSADYDPLMAVCERYGIPMIEDAAEAIGATYRGRATGTFGDAAVFSFNGNKIITTSGGGMLVTASADLADRARHLATQARDPAPHYEHSDDRLQLPPEQPAGSHRPRPAAGSAEPDRPAPADPSLLPRGARRPAGDHLHAGGRVRRAQLLADLRPGGPRVVRR